MESVIKQLVKIGHGMSAEVANDEPAVAKLLVELSSALDVQYERANALEDKCAALAAESSATNDRLQKLIQIISNADNDYCMCGDAMKSHVHGGCGHPTGMFDYHYNQWLQAENQTPATDAFLAEVRAQGIEMLTADRKSEWMDSYIEDASEFAAQLRQEAAQ